MMLQQTQPFVSLYDLIFTFERIDWIIIGCFVIAFIYGAMRGFMRQLISIASFFAALLVSMIGYRWLSPWLQREYPLDRFKGFELHYEWIERTGLEAIIYHIFSFILLFICFRLLLFVVGKMLHIVVRVPGLRTINRLFGGILSFVEFALLLIIAIHFLQYMDYTTVGKWIANSYIANLVLTHTPWLIEFILMKTVRLN